MTWFEGRASKCCLLVFIDDATGRLMHLRFGETESAFDYIMATREYLEQHGKPLAFYSDKHGIFRVNNGGSTTAGVTHAEHTPLYRQSEIYDRQGVELSRSLLSGRVDACCRLLSPLEEALQDYVLADGKLHADDTPVPVL